jgi:hypothetical protein
VTGQVVSEGKGELSFDAYASTLGANPTTVAASQPTSTYSVGQSDGHNLDMGTCRVKVGKTKDVKICVFFTEHDSGLNDENDRAFECPIVTLSCSGADANGDGQPDGQPSLSTTLGPSPPCGPISAWAASRPPSRSWPPTPTWTMSPTIRTSRPSSATRS